MVDRRRLRDPDLLEALDSKPRSEFQGRVWRAVHERRNPLDPSRAGGRWDLGVVDVLYTSLAAEGAIAEIEYYLNLQPVFPSKMRHACYEIKVRLSSVIHIESVDELVALGVDRARYTERLYERTAEIGDAAAFLGCDGLVVPSARSIALNLVIFMEGVEPGNLNVIDPPVPIDWQRRARTDRTRKLPT
jgi:RES domain-containing protein